MFRLSLISNVLLFAVFTSSNRHFFHASRAGSSPFLRQVILLFGKSLLSRFPRFSDHGLSPECDECRLWDHASFRQGVRWLLSTTRKLPMRKIGVEGRQVSQRTLLRSAGASVTACQNLASRGTPHLFRSPGYCSLRCGVLAKLHSFSAKRPCGTPANRIIGCTKAKVNRMNLVPIFCQNGTGQFWPKTWPNLGSGTPGCQVACTNCGSRYSPLPPQVGLRIANLDPNLQSL